MGWLAELRTGLLSLLWPEAHRCSWCGGLLGQESGDGDGGPNRATAAMPPTLSQLCPSCRQAIERGPVRGPARWPVTAVVAVAPYGEGLAAAIQALKYRRRRGLAASLGEALAAAAHAALPQGGLLVPVPLHPSRFRERGFNQSELLGREVARRLGWPLERRRLRRTRPTRSQAKLGRLEREANLRGAFSTEPGWAAPEHVILVDDVYTTGATTSACAAALAVAGARRVDVLVLAIDR